MRTPSEIRLRERLAKIIIALRRTAETDRLEQAHADLESVKTVYRAMAMATDQAADHIQEALDDT